MFQQAPDVFFQTDRHLEVAKRGLDVSQIESLIAERQKAREGKDWQRADDIRKELAALNITLKDAAGRTVWSVD